MLPHLLRCQGFAVNDYNFTLGHLEAGAPSTFAQLGYNDPTLSLIWRSVTKYVIARENAVLRFFQ